MISMTEFQRIIQLRNAGKTQDEIAKIVGVSRRSVIRYLKMGKIPEYSRANKSTRADPLAAYFDIAVAKLEEDSTILLSELYEYLQRQGYTGSARSLRRKTFELRQKLKTKEVYFQREVHPGEVMEGDFTELWLVVGNTKRKIYLWVTTLPFSNAFFATAFYNCTFECFAHGSIKAFEEFNGIAQKYRLDNMSPAVSKILKGKDRLVTKRFKEFQEHYGFKQDFCNPARGNEKGNVESNIRHIKSKLLSKIQLDKVTFSTLESLREYLWTLCRTHNKEQKVQSKFIQESLINLPAYPFNSFRTTVAKINKFSLFSLDKTRHMYSVPSQYIGLSLEVRIYFDRVDIIEKTQVIASHKRLYGPCGIVSIQLEHVINGLVKKPGAMDDWKHRHVLFERPAWQSFYKKLIEQGGKNKDYLSCLRLIKQHGKELVTLAMEVAITENKPLSSTMLEQLIANDMSNIYQLKPLDIHLEHYDELIKGATHGCEPESKP